MTFGTRRWWGCQSHAQASFTPEMFLVLIFTRGWVDPRTMERSERDMSRKNPVTPSGIDPGTVRLVAQRLHHYATPGPNLRVGSWINRWAEGWTCRIMDSSVGRYAVMCGWTTDGQGDWVSLAPCTVYTKVILLYLTWLPTHEIGWLGLNLYCVDSSRPWQSSAWSHGQVTVFDVMKSADFWQLSCCTRCYWGIVTLFGSYHKSLGWVRGWY
jgi:hypothetical protein